MIFGNIRRYSNVGYLVPIAEHLQKILLSTLCAVWAIRNLPTVGIAISIPGIWPEAISTGYPSVNARERVEGIFGRRWSTRVRFAFRSFAKFAPDDLARRRQRHGINEFDLAGIFMRRQVVPDPGLYFRR